MSRKRRTWSAQEKANVVLEILREESTLAEISRKYEIAQPVLSRWKSEFIDNMPAIFDKKGENTEKIQKEHEEEKERLIKKIGELSMDVDYLKKKQEQVLQMRRKKL
jgi:transposase-like protein